MSAAQDREARRIEHAAAFGVNPSDVTDEVLDRDQPAATTFIVTTVETATTQYTVEATSYDEAREKVERGEYGGWRDLGHDDMEVIDVKLATA